MDPNITNTIQKWVKALDNKNTTEAEIPQINEKDFILNFLQKKRKNAETSADKEAEDLPKSVKDKLSDQGLSP